MKKYMELLQSAKLFEKMSDADIRSMLLCLKAVKKNYGRGQYIYQVGDHISKTGMVLEGVVHIDREDYWGNHSILAEISAGELLGETYACLDEEPCAINAVAAKESVVLLMDMKKIFDTCTSVCPHHAKLIQNFVKVIAGKNRELTRKMEHLSQRTIRGKLLSYLSEQSLKAGVSSFDIPFDRQQLADFLSVDRSAMSKELGKLRREGILVFRKNHFQLMTGKGNDIS